MPREEANPALVFLRYLSSELRNTARTGFAAWQVAALGTVDRKTVGASGASFDFTMEIEYSGANPSAVMRANLEAVTVANLTLTKSV